MGGHMNEPLKRCTKCGKDLPATPEYFYRDRSHADGLSSQCKECKAPAAAKWALINPEKKKDAQRKWVAKNKDRVTGYKRSYEVRNKDEQRERRKRWAKNNPDKVSAKNRKRKAYLAEWMRKWRKDNPDKSRAVKARRRARENASPTHYTAADVKRQYNAQKGRCYYCGCSVKSNFHVDHVIPLSRGGSNGPENIVIACQPCNKSKGAKLPHEWPEGGRLL